MQPRLNLLHEMIFGHRGDAPPKIRRSRRVQLFCESLEGRVVPSHLGIAHHAVAHLHTAAHHSRAETRHAKTETSTTASASTTSTSTASTVTSGTSTTPTSTTSSTLSTAIQTLKSDVQTIELASGTTVGELAAISVAFQALKADGLTPSSQSALRSFENSLVTDSASGTTLAGDATLLGQFEALYTTSPTTQETTDLTTAYTALAAAVTSSNITSADITTINTDWAAVLAAKGSTSADTFAYFTLVTGQGFGGPGGGLNCNGDGEIGHDGSSNSALSTALQTLQNDVQTIELASRTTNGQLAAIAAAFETLKTDGLTPSSRSALKSFENSLVTAFASGTTLAGDTTLLNEFEALYTSSPTTQETTDLTTAYNALAAAVTSSNITSADITTINTDWAAVLAAEASTSTATYTYFNLVAGQGNGFGGPGGPGGFGGSGGGGC